jgi:hypothetical protein
MTATTNGGVVVSLTNNSARRAATTTTKTMLPWWKWTERMILMALCCIVGCTFWMGVWLENHQQQQGGGLAMNSHLRSLLETGTKIELKTIPDTTTTTANGGTSSLWGNNPNIPKWLKSYMTWHHQVITTDLTSHERKQKYKYLILRCYRFDERCGGVSDRLKPIPLLLYAAAQSNRIFFIHWHDRPCSLEEFLVPPVHGFNWTVPNFLVDDFLSARKGAITRAGMVLQATQGNGWIKSVHIHGTVL